MSDTFASRYGPWALVAGASEGLGAAFAEQLASRGLNLLLAARRPGPLATFAATLRAAHAVEVRELAVDLGDAADLARLREAAAGLDVGLLVCNAAASPIGPYLDRPAEEHARVLDTNCRAPALLAHELGNRMVRRGRGGILLMSSMAGLQGTARVVHYAATKAYLRVLAEGLWVELAPRGVDVLACVAGTIATPAFASTRPAPAGPFVPAALEPREVAAAALDALGHGPVRVPGTLDRLAAFAMQRLLPRALAVRIISATMLRMYPG